MAAHIAMAVTNDLVTDQRVHRIATTLTGAGYTVTLIGRRLPKSPQLLPRQYRCSRMRLIFKRGMLFYAEFNIRLFVKLLIINADAFTANDLDTLPGAWLATVFTRKKLVYDSHEYYTQVPELQNRGLKRKLWERAERFLVPRTDACMTVCQSIADIYLTSYRRPFAVVRNLPLYSQFPVMPQSTPLKTILYQGSVNSGRGLDLMIDAMPMIVDAQLVVVGGGDVLAHLQEKVQKMDIGDTVRFVGRVPFEALRSYTLNAQLGISLEENLGLNYYYALPNKIFDYIQCGVPVLVSDLPEMRRIVSHYGVGKILEQRTPEALARICNEMLGNDLLRQQWQANAIDAAQELCWENEQQTVIDLYHKTLA